MESVVAVVLKEPLSLDRLYDPVTLEHITPEISSLVNIFADRCDLVRKAFMEVTHTATMPFNQNLQIISISAWRQVENHGSLSNNWQSLDKYRLCAHFFFFIN